MDKKSMIRKTEIAVMNVPVLEIDEPYEGYLDRKHAARKKEESKP